jgi:hypothetical protein
MYNPTREQARQFFIDAWRKHRSREVLTPLEHIAADLILLHPEYQSLLDDAESALSRDYSPELGQTNPFLHLSLHLAIEEQLAIDQPLGIRAAFEGQLARLGDRHEALHRLLECLAEIVWRSQRDRRPPDHDAYLTCIQRR